MDDEIIKQAPDGIKKVMKSIIGLPKKDFTALIDHLVYTRMILLQDLKERIVFNYEDLQIIGPLDFEKNNWASIRFRYEGYRFKYSVYVTCTYENGQEVALAFRDASIVYNDLINQVNAVEFQRGTEIQLQTGPAEEPIFGKLFSNYFFEVRNTVFKMEQNAVHVVLKSFEDLEILVHLEGDDDENAVVTLHSKGYRFEDGDS